MHCLGETGELSLNPTAMLRISTLSAWDQLQASSVQQGYLEIVVKPYRSTTLSSLWIASLRNYTSIYVDSESLYDSASLAMPWERSLITGLFTSFYSVVWPFTNLNLLANSSTIPKPGLSFHKQ